MAAKNGQVNGKNVLDIEKCLNESVHFRTRIDVDESEQTPIPF
jgi:hypothetical protein